MKWVSSLLLCIFISSQLFGGAYGKWHVETKINPLDDTRTFVAVLSATQGKSSWGKDILLVVRCQSNETDVYINWNDYLGLDSIQVNTRFDSEKAQSQSWSISTDRKASFTRKPLEFIESLVKGIKLVAQTTPYGENPTTAIFDLRGFTKAVTENKPTCNWLDDIEKKKKEEARLKKEEEEREIARQKAEERLNHVTALFKDNSKALADDMFSKLTSIESPVTKVYDIEKEKTAYVKMPLGTETKYHVYYDVSAISFKSDTKITETNRNDGDINKAQFIATVSIPLQFSVKKNIIQTKKKCSCQSITIEECISEYNGERIEVEEFSNADIVEMEIDTTLVVKFKYNNGSWGLLKFSNNPEERLLNAIENSTTISSSNENESKGLFWKFRRKQ